MPFSYIANILAQTNRLDDTSQISRLARVARDETSISDLVLNVANFVVLGFTAISALTGLVSLIIAIIFSLKKSPKAKLWWIIFASSIGIFLLCAFLFTAIAAFVGLQKVRY